MAVGGVATRQPPRAAAAKGADAAAAVASSDPVADPRWAGIKWTVVRGVAYDLAPFLDRHPGGRWLINLAVGRDATGLLETYHLRDEAVAAVLAKLPVLQGFPVGAVPRAPYPSDSALYAAIKRRVRSDVFGGSEARGAHRRGSESAAVAVLSFAVAAYLLFASYPGLLTGLLLGIAGGWIGVTIQHCGNHGAMSTSPLANALLGLTDDLIGGSSLTWRYHHQVSHHIHTNDDALDEDVVSMWPLLRFDARLPRRPWHAWQHLYIWAAYPLMHAAFQLGDFGALARGATVGAAMTGASAGEKATLLAGKAAHYGLLLALPAALHGWAAALVGAAAYSVSLSILLALMFFVSHNVAENKILPGGAPDTKEALLADVASRDWGVAQVLASANWGGSLANWFTGGLNLQIEHHLFPCLSFKHYPAIAKVVKDECAKAGVRYVQHPHLLSILRDFTDCLRQLGAAPDCGAGGEGGGGVAASLKGGADAAATINAAPPAAAKKRA